MMRSAHAKEYVDTDGPVRYLDGSGLKRPIDMPRPALFVMGGFVVAAVVIGAVMLFNVIGNVQGSDAQGETSVEDNLSQSGSLDLPQLTSLFTLDDAAIEQTFSDAGIATYDLSSTSDDQDSGFDLLKLPANMSAADAGMMYLNGVNNLSAADASRLLNGSWRMTVTRDESTEMKIRYADFTSGNVGTAIQAALTAEALDSSTLGESGTDDAGNTFQAGTVDIDGQTCSWRISAIALSSVYDIEGLPDDAIYVGILMTPQAS